MENLILVGAGGFGREVADWLARNPMPDHRVVGFLDDNPNALNGKFRTLPILGPVQGHVPEPGTVYLLTLGTPASRGTIAQTLEHNGARFVTYVSPLASVSQSCELGVGCLICPYASVTTDTRIGDHSVVMGFTGVGHDVSVGRCSMVSAGVLLGGACAIGDESWIASKVCVLPGITLGHRVRVGAGSVVLRNVADDVTVFGVPAKVISG